MSQKWDHNCDERDDGLLYCRTCKGAEGSLPTNCPGRAMTVEEADLVYEGKLDYGDGVWRARSPAASTEPTHLPLEVESSS